MLVAVAGRAATVTELVVGAALLLGVLPRWAALGATATLLVFGLSMFFFSGFETPLSASVFSAAAAAFLLSLAPDRAFILCVAPTVRRTGRRREPAVSATGVGSDEVGRP